MTIRIFSLILLALILVACSRGPEFGPETNHSFVNEEAIVQEVTFRSKGVTIVGDLRRPVEGENHPAVIMVHGDGPATRNGAVMFEPTIRRFLRNGYAVFSWDKPGSGESTGELDEERKLTQRATILVDGMEALAEHPAIDGTRIGLWGLSQAGWVMPLALDEMSEQDAAFMIVLSGGGEESVEQMAYQIGQRILIGGGTPEQAAIYETAHVQFAKATTYDEYHQAMEQVLEIPDINRLTGISFEIVPEKNWRPWPREEGGAFFDPMTIVENMTIPVLAMFGELDKLVDPVQGAEAYEKALQKAGNPDYQIVVLPHQGHVFTTSPQYLDILEAWLQEL